MNVREILSRTPPPLLYHYTSQVGLLGIVRDQEIWASHTQYLNDRREFRHALKLASGELDQMQEEAEGDKRQLIGEMKSGLERSIESVNVCVSSFSEVGDMLSQWRAYGGGTSGFSVGFSGSFLREVSESQDCWLVPCVYQEPEQRALVRTLLEDVLQENVHNQAAALETHQPPGGNLQAYLNRYAPILKDSSFAEEREWRIISRPLMCSVERFDYRPGHSMLIPYYRIPLSSDSLKFK